MVNLYHSTMPKQQHAVTWPDAPHQIPDEATLAQVKQFDLRQLKAMANYLGSLPAEMQTVPQDKFISRTASAK